MSAATTLTATIAAMSQQHEGASAALQGVPGILVMLRGTTGDFERVPIPMAAAAQVAKLVGWTAAASTLQSCS